MIQLLQYLSKSKWIQMYWFNRLYIIKGKGFPDVATRRFIRRLWDDLKLPPLALMDADPHGISIMAVYRFGSQVHHSLTNLNPWNQFDLIMIQLGTASGRYGAFSHASNALVRNSSDRHRNVEASHRIQVGANKMRSILNWFHGQTAHVHPEPTPPRTGLTRVSRCALSSNNFYFIMSSTFQFA